MASWLLLHDRTNERAARGRMRPEVETSTGSDRRDHTRDCTMAVDAMLVHWSIQSLRFDAVGEQGVLVDDG